MTTYLYTEFNDIYAQYIEKQTNNIHCNLIGDSDGKLEYILSELNSTIRHMPDIDKIPEYNASNKYRFADRIRQGGKINTFHTSIPQFTNVSAASKDINEIRIMMNKISPSRYDVQITDFIDKV